MNKVIFIVIILLYNHFDSIAQGWFQQNSGVNFNLNSVCFVDASTGYAVGDSGSIIIKTTNGGTSWVRQVGTYILQSFSVHFINNTTGFNCGGNSPSGYVGKTTNGGTNWINITPDGAVIHGIYGVRFINNMTGIAVGAAYSTAGTIFRTSNGGTNWTITGISGTQRLFGVFFTDALTGYICGEPGVILKTTNAGANWVTQTSGTTAILKSIYFINQATGWTAGSDSKVYKTTNGGTNWFMYYNQSLCGLNSVYFTNEQTGWTCGCEGAINATTNYGSSWMTQSLASTTQLNSLSFISPTTGWAVGNGGRILKTNSGGLTNIEPLSNQIPDKYSLSQNYPNPFNPSTNIKFTIPKDGFANLKIYNLLGQLVRIYFDDHIKAGIYSIQINGEDFASGTYFYTLTTKDFVETKRMNLIK